VDDAAAFNGTSISAITYSPTNEPTDQNYVVFYQHSNGDIRKVIYNELQWHDSEFVTNDARSGSGLTAVWFSSDPILIYLYYIDKNNVLQERRGQHASDTWVNGALGLKSLVAASNYSDVLAQYAGTC
jgi:Fungal fucose-specific lectin